MKMRARCVRCRSELPGRSFNAADARDGGVLYLLLAEPVRHDWTICAPFVTIRLCLPSS